MLVRSANNSNAIGEQQLLSDSVAAYQPNYDLIKTNLRQLNVGYQSSSSSSCSSTSSSSSVLLPGMNASHDQSTSHQMNSSELAQLQHMDDDDYVEHDLDDSGGEDDSDEDDDEDELSDADSDVDDDDVDEVDSDESSSKIRGGQRKKTKTGKSSANTKRNKPRGQLINVNSCHNADNKLYESQSLNSNGNKINEENFVTVTQKDELTSQLHNGILILTSFFSIFFFLD